MRQALIYIGIGLLSGIALATWIGSAPLPRMDSDSQAIEAVGDASATVDRALAARVAQLEAALASEAARHASLEAELGGLREQLGSLTGDDARSGPGRGGEAPTAVAASDVVGENVRVVGPRRFAALRDPEFRLEQLIDAGFTANEAQALIDRESQMRLEMMNQSYEAQREGGQVEPQVDMMQAQQAFQSELRNDLGDQRYERYLRATGQPTSVNVTEVLSNSAGAVAGLVPGDEIVGYNGERVFNLLDLRAQTIVGEPGETVPVDIVRDGQPMQLYITRGPLGISGGGFGRRGAAGAIFIP